MKTTCEKGKITKRTNNTRKMLMASAVAVSAVAGVVAVGDTNEVGASSIYYWEIYDATTEFVTLETFIYASQTEHHNDRLKYWQSMYPKAFLTNTNSGAYIGYYEEKIGPYLGYAQSINSNEYPLNGTKLGKYYKFIREEVINSAPTITSFKNTKVFDVVDANTSAKFTLTATDSEQTNLTANVQYNGKSSTTNLLVGTKEINLSGANFSKGLFDGPIVATVNDGTVNSSPVSINNHIIIKVDNATDYLTDLNGHTNNAYAYTKAQHQAFLKAYEAVRMYETGRTQALHDTAKQAISELITATGGVATATTNKWNERLAVVLATVALEKAESSFVVADFETLQPLYDALTQENKDRLKPRYRELTQYHAGNALLIAMEAEMNRHKTSAGTVLDTTIINTEGFNKISVLISGLLDNTPSPSKSYSTDLNKRLNDVRTYFLKHKGMLSPEDLAPIFSNVDVSLRGMYDEYRYMFGDVTQEMVDYVNTIAAFMKDVNGTTYEAYHNYVDNTLATTKSTTVDMNKIAKVTEVVDAIYNFRTQLKNNNSSFIGQLIAWMDLKIGDEGSTVTQLRFNQINNALKEVTDYTDIPVFDEYDLNEKKEANLAVSLLVAGQFKRDMTSYLTNGIPEIIVIDNPYEFIITDTLTIKGTFRDDNDKHDITITFDGTTQTFKNVTTKSFEAQFTDLSEGVYAGKELSIVVNDGLASKGIKIDKPVISVSNPLLFTDLVKALEKDKDTKLSLMTEPTLTELLAIFNKMIVADRNITPSTLTALYKQAGSLSGDSNGELVNYVRNFIQADLLEWIYDNHTNTTVQDFILAGVNIEGEAVVTTENINDLKTLISDYKASNLAEQTPTIDDYLNWIGLLTDIKGLNNLFTSSYNSNDVGEVDILLEQAQQIVNKVPSWASTLMNDSNSKIEDVTNYRNALTSVLAAETSYVQSDYDTAYSKILIVDNRDANTKLNGRLAILQSIITAEKALVLAETTFDEADISNAKTLIEALVADTTITNGIHKVKIEDLNTRQGIVDNYIAASNYVKQAEDSFKAGDFEQAQIDKNDAQLLVDALESSTSKDSLIERLSALQIAIDEAIATNAVEKAEQELTQTSYDTAVSKIGQLADGTVKNELQNRINLVGDILQAIQLVEKAESTHTQEDIHSATQAIKELPDSPKKNELQQRINDVEDLNTATSKVQQAELSFAQEDKDSAQNLVDALPDTSQKEGLQERLDEVQRVINAMTAVEKAETSLSESDTANAETLIEGLVESDKKVELQERLDAVKKILEAIKAVEKAESTNSQADKDVATSLVDALLSSDKKMELIERLKVVQDTIERLGKEEQATSAVEQAESSYRQGDYDAALALVEGLEDGKVKVGLQDRLTTLDTIVKQFIEAELSVSKAESTTIQEDKDTAQLLVDSLPNSDFKNELQERLEQVQLIIDRLEDEGEATLSVEKAESTLTITDFNTAQTLVNSLGEGTIKVALQSRLDAIKELVKQFDEATKAVENAEGSPTQENKDQAEEIVNTLPDGPLKKALIDRLTAVQDMIDKKSAEERAADSVERAESTGLQKDKDQAQELVNSLIDEKVQTELQKRLDDLQLVIIAHDEAEKQVEKAEVSLLQGDIETAQSMVDALPSTDRKQELQERLDEIGRYLQAEKAVTQAEKSLYQKHKDAAQLHVDLLKDSNRKLLLQERLDTLQKALDDKKTDLLDEIVNNIDNVTPQELADYTNHTVYEELMDDYRKEIVKIGDSITKEQVIEIVKLISSLEEAKRSMSEADIATYQKLFAQSTLPTKSELPAPTVLSSISEYLEEDSALENVITELALALNTDKDSIRSQIENILETIESEQTGSYSIQYVDEDGQVIEQSTTQKVPYGEVTVDGIAPNGYEILGEPSQVVTLVKGEELIVTFVVQPLLEEVPDEVTEEELPEEPLETNEPVFEEEIDEVGEEESTPNEEVPTNEESVEQNKPVNEVEKGSETVPSESEESLDETTSIQDIDVSSITETTIITYLPGVEDGKESIYIGYLNAYATELDKTVLSNDELTQVLEAIHAAYTQAEDAESKISTLPEGAFKESLKLLIQPSETIGVETAYIRSMASVASLSLSNVMLTATPYTASLTEVNTEDVPVTEPVIEQVEAATSETSDGEDTEVATDLGEHAQYLFKAFYALASVKAYSDNPSDVYRSEIASYITSNLYNGEYKRLLLSELGYDLSEIGEAGVADLTPIEPTVVVPPNNGNSNPGESPSNGDTNNDNHSNEGNTSTETPSKDIIKDDATQEVSKVDVKEIEDGFQWTIHNPKDSSYTLSASGIKIQLPIEFEAKMIEVQWIDLGKEQYRLLVKADNKEVKVFKKPINIEVAHEHAYMLRADTAATYSPMPYIYANQLFKFDTKTTGEFYFSPEKVTFSDIKRVFSREAIEELASRHIVNGTGNGKFQPGSKISRGEMAKMVSSALALEPTETTVFKDVKGKWHEDYVQALYEAGITLGTTSSTFGPNASITRQDAVTMVLRLIELSGMEVTYAEPTFADNKAIADYAKEAVGTIQSLGIVNGKPGNKFDPKGTLSRAEFAKILVNTLEFIGKM